MQEKLAANSKFQENLKKQAELLNEQIEVSEKFAEEQDENALRDRLQSLANESRNLQEEADRLVDLLIE